MSAVPYSIEALREYRRRKAEASTVAAKAPLSLKDIPPEAPMEEGIVFGCWNGEAFVSWKKWLASKPVEAFREAPRVTPPVPQPESTPAQPRKARSHRAITASLFASEGEDGRTA
ncbi:MAG TPA: hypothetical protein VKV17_02130 [Bryobacteraceae bacterium]|nr:hypothetical protein [Bryobacteraceae bacterium]